MGSVGVVLEEMSSLGPIGRPQSESANIALSRPRSESPATLQALSIDAQSVGVTTTNRLQKLPTTENGALTFILKASEQAIRPVRWDAFCRYDWTG